MKNFTLLSFLIVTMIINACGSSSNSSTEIAIPDDTGSSSSSNTTTSSSKVTFVVESGFRVEHAAQSYVLIQDDAGVYQHWTPENSGAYLTFKDTTVSSNDDITQLNPSKVSHATDGLTFDTITDYTSQGKPGIKLPQTDSSGNTLYRKFILRNEGMTSQTSLDGGATYTDDEGFRYTLQEDDESSVGYYDVFLNDNGEIILLYIGALLNENANVRLAISTDNGENFVFTDGNPLNDKGTASSGNDHRDPRVTKMPNGDYKLFTMVQGATGPAQPPEKAVGIIYSHTSTDGGHTWTLDDDIPLTRDHFSYGVWSLNDPHVVLLSDGRLRMYVTARVEDPSNAGSYIEVIVSAIGTIE